MKKLILVLIIFASIICLSGCGGYSSEYYSEDETEFIIPEGHYIDTQVVNGDTTLHILKIGEHSGFGSVQPRFDTILYEEIAEENLIVTITEESEPSMEAAVQDETLQVKEDYLDTLLMDSVEYEKWKIQKEHEEFRQIQELKKKKEEGEKLKAKEEIQIQEYDYNIRKQSVEKSIDRLDAQQLKLDSLIKEKKNK
jgi:hypothetical protein